MLTTNDLKESIVHAIDTKAMKEMLEFGDFFIDRVLGKGQQGLVLKARNLSGKQFAIKLCLPTYEDRAIVDESKERFKREAKILLNLKHRNIANVSACGSAKWDGSTKKWQVSADFDDPGDIPFYIMDFIQGQSVKSLFYNRFDAKRNRYLISLSKCVPCSIDLFEQLITQISDAMVFFHSKGVVHRDLKPDNIIFSQHDKNFVIVDFGFARYFKTGLPQSFMGVILKTVYIDLESWQEGTVDSFVDQYMFATMLSEILEGFKSTYTSRSYNGIKSSLEKARAKRKERYASMEEFKKAIQPYLYSYPYKSYYFKIDSFLIPVTRFGYFSKIIRIPFSGSVPLFKEAVDIIDTKDFQRLRGVRQLGPTQFVYPGAGHTRFEHSLGAYFLSLKYLEVLLRNPLFYEAVEDIEEATKLVVLGSLLHDIGHHPFSHWIEELKGLPDELAFVRHEDRAKDIILKGEIGENIRTRWRIDPSKVCRLIAGGKLSPREELLRSIVDSDIDVDRIDYLQRDSAHCGVPYGLAFDVERLVGSLWVNKAHNKICLTDKGRSSFISLLVSNIIMYQEVYWHKTTRACTAMFKRFFYECLVKGKISIERITRKYLFYPDEKFIETLYNINRKDKELTSLIRPFLNEGRVLHKPVLVHNYGSPLCLIHDNTKDFFNKLAEKDYPKQVEMTLHLAEILKKSQLPELKEYDIILETTPVEYREVAELSGFEFYDTRLEEYEGLTPEIHILNNYLRSNRRAYLYCKPKFYDQMRHLVKNGKMNDIFGDVIEKI